MKNNRCLVILMAALVATLSLAGCAASSSAGAVTADREGASESTVTDAGTGDTELLAADAGAPAGGTSSVDIHSAADSNAAASPGQKIVRLTYGVTPSVPTQEGTAAVEEALDGYLASIGRDYTVDLQPMDLSGYTTNVDKSIISGEDVGIYCPTDGLSKAVSAGRLICLERYLNTTLKQTVDLEGERLLECGSVNGTIYGIPCYKGYILNYYWVVDKVIFDATGYGRSDVKGIDSLAAILERIHEQNPQIAAIAPTLDLSGRNIGNSYSQLDVLASPDKYMITDLDSALGLVLVGNDCTVRNVYETGYFREACQLAWQWNQAGLTVRDASVSTDNPTDVQQAGRAASFIIGYGNTADSVASMTDNTYAFTLSRSMMTASNLVWGIATTCPYPEEAADFLNLMNTDAHVINDIIYGVQGEDYIITGEENGTQIADFPEGKDIYTVPYTAQRSGGAMGNQFLMYAFEGGTTPADLVFMKNNMDHAVYSPAYGFQVDTSDFSQEAVAITAAAGRYRGGLLCGELDPDIYIPQFVTAVNAAGMQDAVDICQQQLDAWRAAQQPE